MIRSSDLKSDLETAELSQWRPGTPGPRLMSRPTQVGWEGTVSCGQIPQGHVSVC